MILRKKNVPEQNTEASPKSMATPGRFSFIGLLFAFTILWDEAVIRMVSLRKWGIPLFLPLFAGMFGCIFSFIYSYFYKKPRLQRWITRLLLALVILWYEIEMVFHAIFGSFMEVALVRMGGDAVTNYFIPTLVAIWEGLFGELLLIVPLALYEILWRKLPLRPLPEDRKQRWRYRGKKLVGAVFHYGLFVLLLLCFGEGDYTPFRIYYGQSVEVGTSIETVGVIPTFTAEVRYIGLSLLGQEEKLPEEEDEPYTGDVNEVVKEITGQEDDDSPEAQKDNVLSLLDFSELTSEDEEIQYLNDYFASVEPTPQNEYTGYFEGKSLITICAESFSPAFLSEELTPTLWKLTHEGFVFNNYYGSFPNTTTDGEYTFCTGLFPDLSRHKSNGSMKASSGNLMPYTLGNVFRREGLTPRCYHNYYGSFYSRNTSHPNMGYDFFSMNDGMTFTTTSPASDWEMIVQSVEDYVGEERFHTYYMTYSGHYPYDFTHNAMSIKNQELVEDLPYSDKVKAYIACNMELERALAELLSALKAAGHGEDTVICLTNDHYPYGLSAEDYQELTGEEETSFSKYKNALVLWCGSMEETVEVDNYCCTVDVLPTLLNLFGLEYDSRLLIGRDILADTEHVAILKNRSFLSDLMGYDALSEEITPFVEESSIPSWYVEDTNYSISRKMTVSRLILEKDYYRYLQETLGLWEEEE